jgi:hypothetical protein
MTTSFPKPFTLDLPSRAARWLERYGRIVGVAFLKLLGQGPSATQFSASLDQMSVSFWTLISNRLRRQGPGTSTAMMRVVGREAIATIGDC